MFSHGAKDAAQTVLAALLDYYSNAPSAAGHIVSLSTGPYNGTGAYSNSSDSGGLEDAIQDNDLVASGTAAPGSSAGGGPGATSSTSTSTYSTPSGMPIWLIPSYTLILFFAVLGNLLVISTLVQNRRMRTITNVFLLNLAISDMLLGVLCMPVTLVGTLLRNFIFGEFLCKLFQFSQGKLLKDMVRLSFFLVEYGRSMLCLCELCNQERESFPTYIAMSSPCPPTASTDGIY